MRLVASDLDGTLLLPDRTLSPRTVRVLREVVEAGIVLVLVSARPPRTLRPLAQELQAKGLAICCNGSLIYDLEGAAVRATHSGAPFVEVSAGGIEKASALAWLAHSLGILQQDVVAFGDMPNDLAMIGWAGHGVAVANAHPAVLAAADEVTLSHVDDGVAVALERMLRERQVPLAGPMGGE